MFECSRCTARALRALTRDAPPHIRRAALLPATQHTQRRNAIAISQANIDRDDENLPFDGQTKALGIAPVPKRHLELELQWLNDRVKLAEEVKKMITERNQLDKAIALVQLASKSRENNVTVAWNHLLRYTLDSGQSEKAFSLFNDMKKRGQIPDSHTYLIMLKGFGITKNEFRKPTAKDVSRVVNIYHSMSSPNSKVKPSILHVNAALQACSLSTDVDTIYTIISGLEEEGPNSANNITYTVLLNAIRVTALKDTRSDTNLETIQRLKLEAARQGREYWVGIIKRWRKGALQMDEQLVIAMAQLLLFSPSIDDWDDVLNLFEQTMGLKRPLESPNSRNIGHIPPGERIRRQTGVLDDAFQSQTMLNSMPPPAAKPGPSTVSVLLKTCSMLRAPTAATRYWVDLTEKLKIKPDPPSLMSFLRICHINRSSAAVARVLSRAVGDFKLRPADKAFEIAMSTCARDNKNPNVIKNAAGIIDVVMNTGSIPPIPMLEQYLLLSLSKTTGQTLPRVLEHLVDGPVSRINKLVTHDPEDGSQEIIAPELLAEIRGLLQGLSGAIDTLNKRYKDNFPDKYKSWLERKSNVDRLRARTEDKLKAMGRADLFHQQPNRAVLLEKHNANRKDQAAGESESPAGFRINKFRRALRSSLAGGERSRRLESSDQPTGSRQRDSTNRTHRERSARGNFDAGDTAIEAM